MANSRVPIRAMIFYDFKKRLTVDQSHESLVEALGEDAPSLSTIRYWFHQFEQGREALEDESRSGRPKEAVTQENINRVAELGPVSARILNRKINS